MAHYLDKDGLQRFFNGLKNVFAPKDRGVEYIRGTWTAASGTWTGVSKDSALYDGKQIILYMPFGGSGNATLNLTLADGSTTGAKNVYYENTTRFTTHKGQNSQLHLIYHSGLKLSNGTTYEGWWYMANRDTTDTYKLGRSYNSVKAKAAIYRYQILLTVDDDYLVPVNSVNNSQATTKKLTTEAFDPFGQVYYWSSTATVNADAKLNDWQGSFTHWNNGLIDLRYAFNTGTTLTANKPIYIVCTPQTNGKAKLYSSPIAQALPTTADGLIYKYIGRAYDTYRIILDQDKPCYMYKNGTARVISGWAEYAGDSATVNGHTVAVDVPSGAKFTDTTYSAASQSAAGLMSAADKKKLDGIAAGANAYIHPSYTAKSSGLYKVTVDNMGHVSAATAVAKSDITALGIPAQDTTYSSKAAASGGTDVSLVTTGEKYTWNSKTSNTGTVTSVATGVGLTGGSITTSGTIKAKLRSETALTRDSAAATETANRVYPVVPDKSGYLAVNVPWTDTNTHTITGVKGNSESSYRTGNVNLTAANIGAAAATHYHAAGDVTSGTFDAARIPSLAAGKITSGTFDAARIPSLNASKIGSGTLAAARLPAMTGATASAAGTQGAVPAPAAGKQAQFLRGDGTWATPTDTNTDTKVNVTLATTTKAFLLGTSTTPTTSAKGVTALADTGVYLDTTAGRLTATSFAGNGLLLTNLDAGNLYAGTVPRARLPLASSTQAGAMSAGDKAKLDSIIVTGANSVYLFKFSFAQNTFDSQQSLLYQVEDDDVGFDSTWLPEIIVPPQAGTYSSYASSLKGPIKVTTQADNVLWFQSSYPLLSSLTLWIKLTKTYQSNITEQELSA